MAYMCIYMYIYIHIITYACIYWLSLTFRDAPLSTFLSFCSNDQFLTMSPCFAVISVAFKLSGNATKAVLVSATRMTRTLPWLRHGDRWAASPFGAEAVCHTLRFLWIIPYPRCSMYGIFSNICPKNHPNVGKYTSIMDPMGMAC